MNELKCYKQLFNYDQLSIDLSIHDCGQADNNFYLYTDRRVERNPADLYTTKVKSRASNARAVDKKVEAVEG